MNRQSDNNTGRIGKDFYYLKIAQAAAERSTCLRRKYGAIIVKDDIVISTGYNGAPRGRINCCDRGICYRDEHNIPHGEQYEKCLSAETVITMLDGTYKTIKELADSQDNEFKVYAVDTETGKIVPALAKNVRKTKKVTSLVRIHFDGGGHLDCTSDHRILLRDCTYKEAGMFSATDSITPMCYLYMDTIPVMRVDHKIKKITTISYNDWVYDMEVPKYHNFAVDLGNGSCVFVHNCRSVHAEQNAIIAADYPKMKDATMYVFGTETSTGEVVKDIDCCTICKRMIINAGISHVVFADNDHGVPSTHVPFRAKVISVQDWITDDDSLYPIHTKEP